MKRIQKTIQIKAPAQRVFDYVTQPTNLPSIMPSMIEVSNVAPQPNGGRNFDWIYKMAGVRLKGHSKIEQHEPGKLAVVRTSGGIVSTWTWKFEGDGVGTRLTLDVEYMIPVPVLGKLAEAIVARMNERETELTLAHLKEITESAPATAGIAAQPH